MRILKNAAYLAMFGTLALAGVSSASETASATISSSPLGGGVFQYTLNLTNTSSDSSKIGTYWFSWIPGADYMEVLPTSITQPAGWTANLTGSNNSSDGNAIQFVAGAGSQLAAGGTDVFTFDSTETFSQILGPSSLKDHEVETTAFVYTGGPFSDAGFKLTATTVPEPTSVALLLTGGAGLMKRRRRA